MELCSGALARLQRAEPYGLHAFEDATANARRGEADLDEIRHRAAGVENGNECIVRLACAHGAGMRKREREFGVAHQD